MQHFAAAADMREIERAHLHTRKCRTDRLDARVVRPVGPADDERALVEPEHVAALRELRFREAADDGNAVEAALEALRLMPARGLSGV